MSNFITIHNQKIEYVYHDRDKTRPTLIFLHEGLGCIQMWRDFPAAVADATGCNELVYNRAGYGASSPARLPRQVRYMHDEALDVLPALLSKLDINKHILIGHSDGGSIALINGGGVQSPDLLAIITLAAHVFNEEVCVRSIKEAKVAYETTNLRERLAKYHADVDNTFWGWGDIWLHPDFWHWNIEEYLPFIVVPLLAIQGLDDQYGTTAQVEAIQKGVGQLADIRLMPDCQHSPHRDQREATLAVMVDFIQKVLAKTAVLVR
ncbi:MAG: alpha/beta hydrolase [Anaerolineales bacterium]|nr:alpha/beta hydrolase [Anaerolineales bacterium]